MNKLQKILWSIFSGMICMLYRPTYAELAGCWSQITHIKVTDCTKTYLSSIIASYCRNKTGTIAADCRRENPGTSATNTKGTYVCAEDLVFQN